MLTRVLQAIAGVYAMIVLLTHRRPSPEEARALLLRNRVVEDLARAMGAAELSGRADLGPTGDGVWRVSSARVRTVADVRQLARPWRSWLSPALRAELWPEERPS